MSLQVIIKKNKVPLQVIMKKILQRRQERKHSRATHLFTQFRTNFKQCITFRRDGVRLHDLSRLEALLLGFQSVHNLFSNSQTVNTYT